MDMGLALSIVSAALAVLSAPIWLYLGALTLVSWRRRPPPPPARLPRLVCVVPAHNEAAGIAPTVAGLRAAAYPDELRRILVIADNCTDDTAALARAAGAEVLERKDDTRRGKGYALEAAFQHILSSDFAEGALVVDADTEVAPNLWRSLAAHLAAGAPAVQAPYGVRNPRAGWRPRLLAVALGMINGVRSLGRERLGLSVGLRGTGMAFPRATLERFPHNAYGLVEDVEYGIRLGLAGLRVHYASDTGVLSDMPVSGKVALSQRRRWEGGRVALLRTHLTDLLRRAVGARSLVALDLAIDLLVPPISYPALLTLLGLTVEATSFLVQGQPTPWVPGHAVAAAAAAAYVLRGISVSGTGLGGFFALLGAPAYVVWKIVVARPWRRTEQWVRTEREAPVEPPSTPR